MVPRAHATATRNTCFVIIAAIEEDLRALIRNECESLGLSDVLPSDSRSAALIRWQSDNRSSTRSHPENDYELLDYTDFSDLSKTLHATLKAKQGIIPFDIKEIATALEDLNPTRNRVCHSRPLETGDLPRCLDTSDSFLALKNVAFPSLRHARQRLVEDPSFALGIQIPEYWPLDSRVHHNLPLPEFDDTGFLGRENDRREVHKLLRSHYPVLTIVGEGGVGKTALALRCLYDLIDEPEATYDAIVWVSLKTTTLTEGGLVEVRDAVTSTLGLLRAIADNLGTPTSDDLQTGTLIDEITEYLTEYRILIAADNLETIAGATLRDLLIGIPPGSKLLFTSRVGLGEFETRYALQPLKLNTAVALMRRFAMVLGVTTISKASDNTLKKYCQRLFNSPLLVKWFVASVGRGADAQRVLNREGAQFQNALTFCFTSLHEHLTKHERTVIDTLTSARRPLSSTELYYLAQELSHGEIEEALGTLHTSSMVRRIAAISGSFNYRLSEPATAFVTAMFPPKKELFGKIQKRLKELRQLTEQDNVAQARYRYEIFAVRAQSRDERIAAVYLRQALTALSGRDLIKARRLVEEAKQLLPSYSEAYRVSSLVEAKADDVFSAMEELDQAVQHSPESQIVRYTYAQLLMRELEDHEAALSHLRIAERTDPGDPTVMGASALCLTRLGRYPEAADVYDKLLETVSERPRRWKVTTFDQAAECYRRWSEMDLANKDRDAARRHIDKAFEIVSTAVATQCNDRGTPYRLGRILSDALMWSASGGDDDYAGAFIDQVEVLLDSLPLRHVELRQRDEEILRTRLRPELMNRVAHLSGGGRGENVRVSRSSKDDNGVSPKRHRGVVSRIAEGATYGFLLADDGSQWFVHRSGLVSMGEWTSMQHGLSVSFEIGANDQGPCAVKVELVKD